MFSRQRSGRLAERLISAGCLAAAAAMYGVAVEELTAGELDAIDPRYPVLVTIECQTR